MEISRFCFWLALVVAPEESGYGDLKKFEEMDGVRMVAIRPYATEFRMPELEKYQF